MDEQSLLETLTFPPERRKGPEDRESAQMLNKRISSSNYTYTHMYTHLCILNRHYPLLFKKTWNIYKNKAHVIAKNPREVPHVQYHPLFYRASLYPLHRYCIFSN